jgi:hypothetical protein
LIVIGNYSFSNCVPSAATRKKTQDKWVQEFDEIVEFYIQDEDLVNKVVNTVRFSDKDWILLCTDNLPVHREIADALHIHLVSGSRAEIDEPEEVY